MCANLDLARAAGIEVGKARGNVADDRQRGNTLHVWTIGACVE